MYVVSPSQGVACRSPPISVIVDDVGDVVITFFIHYSISVYIVVRCSMV